MSIYTRECMGSGALDAACISSICGKSWMRDYVNKLSTEQRKKVEKLEIRGKSFVFGSTGILTTLPTLTSFNLLIFSAPGGTRVHRCAAGGCKATSHGRVWVMGKLGIPSSSPWLCMAPEDWRGGGATPLRITPTRTPSAIHPPDAGDKIVQNSAAGGEQHWGT